MPYLLEFTEADLDRPLTVPEKITETVWELFDGKTPVRTKDAADRLARNYGTVKTHLHRAGKLGLVLHVVQRLKLHPNIGKQRFLRVQVLAKLIALVFQVLNEFAFEIIFALVAFGNYPLPVVSPG